MKDVVAALRAIAELDPPCLPPVSMPALPDTGSLEPLAAAMNADPHPVAAAVSQLAGSREQTARLGEDARHLVDTAKADLCTIALELLRQAVPLALASTSNPAADAALRGHCESAVAQAGTRTAVLEEELEPVAAQLDQVETEEPVQQPAPSHPPESGSAAGQAAVDAALSQVGTPYVWGGTGEGGFDCSGLVQWAYGQAGVDLPRTAAEQAVGTQVTADQLQPGDLAVWDGHVAMYTGDGMMIEAGDPVQTNPVRTSNMNMGFQGFWRPTA